MTGGGGSEPPGDIRASDAERDATVERLSAATGDGRLTLEEFSQRMGRHEIVVSLVGGTRVERGPEPGPGAPTVHVRAFSLVGGVRVRRGGLDRRR